MMREHASTRLTLAVTLILIAVVASGKEAQSQTRSSGLLERALKGQAPVVDLTHHLDAGVPTYGGERDSMRYERLASFERDGYAAGAIRVPEHFSTHVDAPGHFLQGRETVDRIDHRRLIAAAVVIDVRAKVRQNPDYQLSAADLAEWERGGRVPAGSAVLLLTGWDSKWSDALQYRNSDASGVMHFPGFSVEAIKALIERKAIALGIDTLSIDYGLSKDFAGHKLSHGAGLYHIENLTNLDKLPARGAVIFVGALPVDGGSGSPARVLAIAP